MTFDDVVDLIGVIVWPLVAIVALIILRHVLPDVLRDLGRRAARISVFQFAVELAPAAVPGDARPPAVASFGSPIAGPSLLPALIAELKTTAPADYMLIDLLEEKGWLTSRLFLWAELLERTRGLRCFAFVRHVDGVRRFLGLGSAADVRWALGSRYPWLESEFSAAYAEAVAESAGKAMAEDRVALGPEVAVKVAEKFIARVRQPTPGPSPDEWVQLTDAWEHARWIDGKRLDSLFGDLLDHSYAEKTLRTTQAEVAAQILNGRGAFVAVVDADRRLLGVADRTALLEQTAAAH
jgi:hypothetical protein